MTFIPSMSTRPCGAASSDTATGHHGGSSTRRRSPRRYAALAAGVAITAAAVSAPAALAAPRTGAGQAPAAAPAYTWTEIPQLTCVGCQALDLNDAGAVIGRGPQGPRIVHGSKIVEIRGDKPDLRCVDPRALNEAGGTVDPICGNGKDKPKRLATWDPDGKLSFPQDNTGAPVMVEGGGDAIGYDLEGSFVIARHATPWFFDGPAKTRTAVPLPADKGVAFPVVAGMAKRTVVFTVFPGESAPGPGSDSYGRALHWQPGADAAVPYAPRAGDDQTMAEGMSRDGSVVVGSSWKYGQDAVTPVQFDANGAARELPSFRGGTWRPTHAGGGAVVGRSNDTTVLSRGGDTTALDATTVAGLPAGVSPSARAVNSAGTVLAVYSVGEHIHAGLIAPNTIAPQR